MNSKALTRSFVWLILLAALLGGLFISLHRGGQLIQTDMLALLPASKNDPVAEEAFARITEKTGKKIMLFVGNTDKARAAAAANAFYAQLQNIPNVRDIQFKIDTRTQDAFIAYYFPYRYHLLSAEYRQLLQRHQGRTVQQRAESSLYSPIGMGLTSLIPQDPFQIFSNYVMNLPFLNYGLFPEGNMLTGKDGNVFYIFISATIGSNALDAKAGFGQEVEAIYKASKVIEKKFPGTKFLYSGFAFHSNAGATSSKREIGWIGNISLLGVIFLMLLNFRSIKPLILALLSIGVGLLAGTSVTLLIFKQLHILTLVFGSALIGAAADYSLLYFSDYFDNQGAREGLATLSRIISGLTWGMGTSVIGYLALLIAPFPGLQQIAVFSAVGLLGAYMTVVLFFPLWNIKFNEQFKPVCLPFSNWMIDMWQRIVLAPRSKYWAVLVLIIFIVGGMSALRTNDEIRLLFNTPRHLITSEMTIRKIMRMNMASQFFLVQGKTAEQVLQIEEALMPSLNSLIADKHLTSYQALSQIVPSKEQQKRNYALVEQYLFKPYFSKQAGFLELTRSQRARVQQELKREKDRYIDFNDWIQSPQGKTFEHLWLGKIHGEYASVIMLNDVRSIAALEKIARAHPQVRFLNKMGDITAMFRHYRHMATGLGAGAYVLIFLLLCWRYKMKKAFVVLLSPVLASVITLAILGYCYVPLSLFSILGLILVLSMGIDYTLFFAEGAHNKENAGLGVLLAACATTLSFGTLAFSATPLVKTFGVTILAGIVLSYVLSPLVTCFEDDHGHP